MTIVTTTVVLGTNLSAGLGEGVPVLGRFVVDFSIIHFVVFKPRLFRSRRDSGHEYPRAY